MLNFHIPRLPERTQRPRTAGVTMALDKGLSLREVEDLLSMSAEYLDFIKLGWCTSYVSPHLKEKIALYRSAGVEVYFGGTLFEAFVARNAYDDFRVAVDKFDIRTVEISSGSLEMATDEKLDYIRRLKADYRVLSEVGSKDSARVMAPYIWVESIKAELDAGAEYVITESRESGTVGIYRATGEVRSGLIDEILHEIPADKLIFETPLKEQQSWFIKLLGANVNLGNIAPDQLIGLETLRLGLRSDTFHTFLG